MVRDVNMSMPSHFVIQVTAWLAAALDVSGNSWRLSAQLMGVRIGQVGRSKLLRWRHDVFCSAKRAVCPPYPPQKQSTGARRKRWRGMPAEAESPVLCVLICALGNGSNDGTMTGRDADRCGDQLYQRLSEQAIHYMTSGRGAGKPSHRFTTAPSTDTHNIPPTVTSCQTRAMAALRGLTWVQRVLRLVCSAAARHHRRKTSAKVFKAPLQPCVNVWPGDPRYFAPGRHLCHRFFF